MSAAPVARPAKEEKESKGFVFFSCDIKSGSFGGSDSF